MVRPNFDDPDDEQTWSSGSVTYTCSGSEIERVEHSGNNFICRLTHVSAASGDEGPPTETNKYWTQVDGFNDEIHIDTFQAYFMGAGRPGFRNHI